MSIAGNLRTMQLAELLQWLSQGKKTGSLIITNGAVEKRVLFGAGIIVSTASTDPAESLGHFLVHYGVIDEAQLAGGLAEKNAAAGRYLGRVLLDAGTVTRERLETMLRLKAEESLYELFSWPEGEFRFVEEAIPREMVPLALDVTGLVLEAMQRQDEWSRIREAIPHRRAIPISVGRLDDDAEASPADLAVLALVDDRRSVEEIALRAHSSEFKVCRVLFRQTQRGRLKVAVPPLLEEVQLPAAVDAHALLRLAQTYLHQHEYERTARHLRAARSLEPDNRPALLLAEQLEESVRSALERDGVTLDAVPRLTRRLDEILNAHLSPQEGFVLSRVDGRFDVGSILKITPLAPLEAHVTIWKLLQGGHILLAPRREAAAERRQA